MEGEPIAKRTRRSGGIKNASGGLISQTSVEKRQAEHVVDDNTEPEQTDQDEMSNERRPSEVQLGSESEMQAQHVYEMPEGAAEVNETVGDEAAATATAASGVKNRKQYMPLLHENHTWHRNKGLNDDATIYYDCSGK